MKRQLSMLCGAVALLCLLSMFMPIVAPKFSARLYHPGSESYTRDYVLVGDYYCAREYWSMSRFALSSGHRLILSVSMGLLLYWATLSFMGERAGITGVIATTVNLAVMGFLMISMIGVMTECRPFVIGVIVIDAIMAAAVAWVSLLSGRRKKSRYITVPLRR